jgi:hypothetical protein
MNRFRADNPLERWYSLPLFLGGQSPSHELFAGPSYYPSLPNRMTVPFAPQRDGP